MHADPLPHFLLLATTQARRPLNLLFHPPNIFPFLCASPQPLTSYPGPPTSSGAVSPLPAFRVAARASRVNFSTWSVAAMAPQSPLASTSDALDRLLPELEYQVLAAR